MLAAVKIRFVILISSSRFAWSNFGDASIRKKRVQVICETFHKLCQFTVRRPAGEHYSVSASLLQQAIFLKLIIGARHQGAEMRAVTMAKDRSEALMPHSTENKANNQSFRTASFWTLDRSGVDDANYAAS
jgi:hypothetical protein